MSHLQIYYMQKIGDCDIQYINMDLVHTVILTVISGICQFLPISSSGHIILVSSLLNISRSGTLEGVRIVVQLGATLAAIVLYAKTLMNNKPILGKVIAGFIPMAVVSLIFYSLITQFLSTNVYITLVMLFLGGVAIILLEKLKFEKESGTKLTLKSLGIRDALVIGAFQTLSIIPGVSRSGASMIGGMVMGMNRKSAIEFSFMLAIPTLIFISMLDLAKNSNQFNAQNGLSLLVSFVLSFVISWLFIKWFLRFTQNHTFVVFGIYRIVLAVLYLLIFIR